MIFIKWNENNEITYTHYMPFSDEHGLGKTKEELLTEGAFVSEMPTIECPNNKIIVHKYNRETNEVYCELIDRPLTEEETNANKISILQQENKELKESQLQQDRDILVTQEAVDFLMLSNMPMVMNLNNIKLGGNTMAAYIATRIMKKGNISIEAGRDYYVTFLTHQSYIQYKSEVDLILKAEGKEELIVDLSNM